jgi:uncharacterized damage-inducible protein DinB
MDIREFFLKQKQATYYGTVNVLEKIPRDHLAWRPSVSMLSLGGLVRHLWTSEEGIRRIALHDQWDYLDARVPNGLAAYLGEVESMADEFHQVERVHADTLREAGDLPLEDWELVRENPKYDFHRKVSAILYGITEHQIHHRAQIGTYVRILTGDRASSYKI